MMFIVNVIVYCYCLLLLNKQLKKIRDKSSEKN